MKKLSLTIDEYSNLREIYLSELEKAQKKIEHVSAMLKKMDVEFEIKPEVEAITKEIKASAAKTPAAERKVTKVAAPKSAKKEKVVKAPKAKAVAIEADSVTGVPAVKSKRGRKPKAASELAPAKEAKVKTVKTKVAKKRKPISKGKGADKVKWNDFVLECISEANAPILSSVIATKALAKFNVKEADSARVKQVISGALSKLVTTEKKLQAVKVPGSREKLYGHTEWFEANGELLPQFKSEAATV